MTRTTHRRRTIAGLGLAATLALAACGGGDDSAESTTAAPTTRPTTTTTRPPTTTAATTTTVPETTTTTTTVPETTTTVAPAPTWPLTGLPLADPADLTPMRRAAVVKLANTGGLNGQAGLDHADIVYEENVEYMTRFAAVYQSQTPEEVGPIRSGRTQDVYLLESLNHPLFLWSGGNGNVTQAINESQMVPFNETRARPLGIQYRVRGKRAPHNLYGSLGKLWENSPPELATPPPQFTYAAGQAPPALSLPAARADLEMKDGLRVTWEYDPATGRYFRSQKGNPHTDANGTQISTENVVVLYVDYQPSPADRRSPEAQTTGSGEAFVLFDGVVTHATWWRTDQFSPWAFTDDNGNQIPLNPGNTWVELAYPGALTLG
jgi:hypothetical protein